MGGLAHCRAAPLPRACASAVGTELCLCSPSDRPDPSMGHQHSYPALPALPLEKALHPSAIRPDPEPAILSQPWGGLRASLSSYQPAPIPGFH